MYKFYERLIGNTVFAHLMLGAVVTVAFVAAFSLKRESNPHIELPFIEVSVTYPGADPQEVAEGISRKVEAAIDGMGGIKGYITESSEGRSSVVIEVADGFDPVEVKERVRNAVDSIETLPVKARRPIVRRQEIDEEVLVLAIWGELPERQLKNLAEEVRSELQMTPDISVATIFGARDYEISVEVSQERLRQLDLTLTEVSDAIRRSSREISTGSLLLEQEEVRLRTIGKRETAQEIADVVIRAEATGEIVRVRDIGKVIDSFVESAAYTTFNGKPAAVISVQKVTGEDAITINEAVHAYIAQKQPELPAGVTLTAAFDNTDFIQSQIRMITQKGFMGLGLVLLVLWLFLETRLAFWVAMGVPISLGGGLILLWLIGGSLNQISMMAMIVVMGIIVDDAIVVGEAIYVHRKRGKSPLQASIDGLREVAMPVLASVSTTIMAFMPMLFMPGWFGQFVRQMPYVIITALLVSLIECFFLLPAHLAHSKGTPERLHPKGRNPLVLRSWVSNGLERFVESVYGPFVYWAVEFRYVTLCGAITIMLVTAGFIGGGFVQVIMWPAVEADFAQGYVEFPPGTPPSTVHDAIIRMEEAAERLADRTPTENGEPLLLSMMASAPSKVGTGGRVVIQMTGANNRDIGSNEFMAKWEKEIGTIPGALVLSFEGDTIGAGGPGGDIEFWFLGDDLASLRATADEFKAKLRTYEGVFQIQDNFRPGKKEIRLALKPSAYALGLTLDDLNNHLYAGYYGEEAMRIQRGREDVCVKVRYPASERASVESLYRSRIRTPQGHEVPFLTVAEVSFEEGVSTISGRNGITGVQVSAAVDRKVASPAEINTDLTDNFLDAMVAKHPGVEWSLSGNEQSNRETMVALQRNSMIAIMGIFVILATIFRSYAQTLIIMLVIPYGIVGAILGHMLLGLPLSFLSIGGITALAGVLVNDSIVLIERANTNLALGMKLPEAVCKAGQRRFRAILLTSLSTCIGLAPIIMETDLQAQIVIPMAVSIAAGVAFGTLLTLVLIPAFLVIMNDMRRVFYRVVRGTWPTQEEVEPATRRAVAPEVSGLEEPHPVLPRLGPDPVQVGTR